MSADPSAWRVRGQRRFSFHWRQRNVSRAGHPMKARVCALLGSVSCASIFAQPSERPLARERWGAPLVTVSESDGKLFPTARSVTVDWDEKTVQRQPDLK